MKSPVIAITTNIEMLDSPPSEHLCCCRRYPEAIAAHGGIPLLLPLGLSQVAIRQVLSTVDGVLIPGGADVDPAHYHEAPHPKLGAVSAERDSLEIPLIQMAREMKVPLLGICRGAQVLNVACGGSLYQDMISQNPDYAGHHSELSGGLKDTLSIVPGTRLAKVLEVPTISANSLHHQSVKLLGTGLVVNARAADGVVEGIEGIEDGFFLGVQCHPEILWDKFQPKWSRLFGAFVAACEEYCSSRHTSA
jgi:putative glutamine amidotransferase